MTLRGVVNAVVIADHHDHRGPRERPERLVQQGDEVRRAAAAQPALANASVFAFSERWPHSGYRSRATVAEGAGLNAQGTGSIQIAVPARGWAPTFIHGVSSPFTSPSPVAGA